MTLYSNQFPDGLNLYAGMKEAAPHDVVELKTGN